MACTRIITGLDDAGSFILNHDALASILSKLDKANRRFAIISIAGQMRTGKSFLLNFLIRCLRNGGPSKPNWIGNNETSAREGVVWRGGPDPETRGIHIWDEIFTLTRHDGEKISVLLMDTQGLFDHDTVPGNNLKLFTLSTLASSVQILNVFRQITERDLEHLQLCVEYADAVSKQDTRQFKLQHLLMLIRDWPYADDYPYGIVGGEGYKKYILAKRVNKPELNIVREHLERSFEKLQCFLMPGPGDKVERTGSFRGRNSELDKKFLEQVKIFTNHLLNPDNLALKTMNGKELGNFLMACDNSFISGKVPKVINIAESCSMSFWASRYEECVREFFKVMEGKLQGNIPKAREEIEDIYSDAVRSALHQFDAHKEFFLSPSRLKYRYHLKEECMKIYNSSRERNAMKLQAVKQKIANDVNTCADQYRNKMNEACGGSSLTESVLHSSHDQFKSEALSSFDELTRDYAKFVQESKTKLEGIIAKDFDNKSKDNNAKVKEEKLAREVKEFELRKLRRKLLSEYEKTLRNELSGKCKLAEDLDKYLKDSMQTSLECFDKKMERYPDHKQKYRQDFMEKLRSLNDEFREQNERTKRDILKHLEITYKQEVLDFKAKMLQKLQSSYIEPDNLKAYCKNFTREKLKELQANIRMWKHVYEFKALISKLEKEYENATEDILLQNRKNKELRHRRFREVSSEQTDWGHVIKDIATTAVTAVQMFAVNPILGGIAAVGGALCMLVKGLFNMY